MFSMSSSGVGDGKGIARGVKGETGAGERSSWYLWKGLRVCKRETGDANLIEDDKKEGSHCLAAEETHRERRRKTIGHRCPLEREAWWSQALEIPAGEWSPMVARALRAVERT